MVRLSLLPSLLLLAATAPEVAAQGVRRAQGAGSEAAVTISAKVGNKSYESSGAGRCRHAPEASIYGVPAALWMVEYTGGSDGGLKGMNMTLWRPKDGSAEQLSLDIQTRSASHQISVGGKGEQMGSGKASLSPAGSGGRFEVKGKDAEGTALEIVIQCPTFAGVEAEGG